VYTYLIQSIIRDITRNPGKPLIPSGYIDILPMHYKQQKNLNLPIPVIEELDKREDGTQSYLVACLLVRYYNMDLDVDEFYSQHKEVFV